MFTHIKSFAAVVLIFLSPVFAYCYDFDIVVHNNAYVGDNNHNFTVVTSKNEALGSEIYCLDFADKEVNVLEKRVQLQISLSIDNYLNLKGQIGDEIIFTNHAGQFRLLLSKPSAVDLCPIPILKSQEGVGTSIKAGAYSVTCETTRASGYKITITPYQR